jgi:hypothetical protein
MISVQANALLPFFTITCCLFLQEISFKEIAKLNRLLEKLARLNGQAKDVLELMCVVEQAVSNSSIISDADRQKIFTFSIAQSQHKLQVIDLKYRLLSQRKLTLCSLVKLACVSALLLSNQSILVFFLTIFLREHSLSKLFLAETKLIDSYKKIIAFYTKDRDETLQFLAELEGPQSQFAGQVQALLCTEKKMAQALPLLSVPISISR